MNTILMETERLVLRRYREGHLKENVWFWKDENGKTLWKDTYIYAIRNR